MNDTSKANSASNHPVVTSRPESRFACFNESWPSRRHVAQPPHRRLDPRISEHLRPPTLELGHLSAFKVPKGYVYGELPKTSTGKVQTNLLRNHIAG